MSETEMIIELKEMVNTYQDLKVWARKKCEPMVDVYTRKIDALNWAISQLENKEPKSIMDEWE